MTVRAGINGFGRIGCLGLRAGRVGFQSDCLRTLCASNSDIDSDLSRVRIQSH